MTCFIVSWGHTLTPVLKSADLFARCPSCTALTFVVCLIGLEASRRCRYFTSLSPDKPWSWRSARAVSKVTSLGRHIIMWPDFFLHYLAHEIWVNIKRVRLIMKVCWLSCACDICFFWTTDGWQHKPKAPCNNSSDILYLKDLRHIYIHWWI